VGVIVLPLNKSVIILKEKDVVVSNDHWYVAIEISTKIYEDAKATIRLDLEIIESQHKGLTPIVERKLIEV
jgi:hypothetical protein